MKKDTASNIGGRIRTVRGEMSQQEFAVLLGVGRTTLIRYEKNERKPDIDFILKLNFLYKVQPMWLLTGMGDETSGEKLSGPELQLIKNYRSCSIESKSALLRLAQDASRK